MSHSKLRMKKDSSSCGVEEARCKSTQHFNRDNSISNIGGSIVV
jgi:hypothetical protein